MCRISATSSGRISISICCMRCTARRGRSRRRVQPKGTKAGINLLSSLELIQGATKVYETPLVQAKAVNVEGRDAVAVELDVPLEGSEAGVVCVPVERD